MTIRTHIIQNEEKKNRTGGTDGEVITSEKEVADILRCMEEKDYEKFSSFLDKFLRDAKHDERVKKLFNFLYTKKNFQKAKEAGELFLKAMIRAYLFQAGFEDPGIATNEMHNNVLRHNREVLMRCMEIIQDVFNAVDHNWLQKVFKELNSEINQSQGKSQSDRKAPCRREDTTNEVAEILRYMEAKNFERFSSLLDKLPGAGDDDRDEELFNGLYTGKNFQKAEEAGVLFVKEMFRAWVFQAGFKKPNTEDNKKHNKKLIKELEKIIPQNVVNFIYKIDEEWVGKVFKELNSEINQSQGKSQSDRKVPSGEADTKEPTMKVLHDGSKNKDSSGSGSSDTDVKSEVSQSQGKSQSDRNTMIEAACRRKNLESIMKLLHDGSKSKDGLDSLDSGDYKLLDAFLVQYENKRLPKSFWYENSSYTQSFLDTRQAVESQVDREKNQSIFKTVWRKIVNFFSGRKYSQTPKGILKRLNKIKRSEMIMPRCLKDINNDEIVKLLNEHLKSYCALDNDNEKGKEKEAQKKSIEALVQSLPKEKAFSVLDSLFIELADEHFKHFLANIDWYTHFETYICELLMLTNTNKKDEEIQRLFSLGEDVEFLNFQLALLVKDLEEKDGNNKDVELLKKYLKSAPNSNSDEGAAVSSATDNSLPKSSSGTSKESMPGVSENRASLFHSTDSQKRNDNDNDNDNDSSSQKQLCSISLSSCAA